MPARPASGPSNFSAGESGGGSSLRRRPGRTDGEDKREQALLPGPAYGCRPPAFSSPPIPGGNPRCPGSPGGLRPGRAAAAAPGEPKAAGPGAARRPLPAAGERRAAQLPAPLHCPRAMNKAQGDGWPGTGGHLLRAGLALASQPNLLKREGNKDGERGRESCL